MGDVRVIEPDCSCTITDAVVLESSGEDLFQQVFSLDLICRPVRTVMPSLGFLLFSFLF